MLAKIMAGAAAAGLALMLIPADPAEAKSRKFRFHPYYGGFYLAPRYVRPRVYYYAPPPFRYYEFEDDYYRPDYYDTPPRKLKKKKSAKSSTSKKKKTEVAAANPAEAAPSEKTTKAAATGGKAVGCDQAQSIIGGYGFEGVKATDCDGQLYSFTATRGGKPYTIKLSSVSGELTEVKKVQ